MRKLRALSWYRNRVPCRLSLTGLGPLSLLAEVVCFSPGRISLICASIVLGVGSGWDERAEPEGGRGWGLERRSMRRWSEI